jgi:hypothetical protein
MNWCQTQCHASGSGHRKRGIPSKSRTSLNIAFPNPALLAFSFEQNLTGRDEL